MRTHAVRLIRSSQRSVRATLPLLMIGRYFRVYSKIIIGRKELI
jgi:hypothetical protein